MKKIMASFFLSTMLIAAASGQEITVDIPSRDDAGGKPTNFCAMKAGGIVLLCVGAASLVTGIILVSTEVSRPAGPMTDAEMNSQITGIVSGVVCIGLAIPMMVGGGVLTGIGSKKCRKTKPDMEIQGGYNIDRRCFARIVCCF